MNTNIYNGEYIDRLIRDLSKLQESIENASQTFLRLGKEGYSQKLSQDWDAYFRRYSGVEDTEKRLCLLYLANDVLQKCRSNGCETYLEHFKPSLLEAMKLLYNSGDSKLIKDTNYILEIWRDRRVYPKETIKLMLSYLNGQDYHQNDIPLKKSSSENYDKQAGGSGTGDNSNLPDDLISIPQELISYTESMNNLKKWVEKTKEADDKLTRIFQNDDGTTNGFNEDEAALMLTEYKKCLEVQQKYRSALLKSLIELIRQSDTDNAKYTHIMKKVIALMDELEKLKTA